MKKNVLLTSMFFLLSMTLTFAQINEVKGVSSIIVCTGNCGDDCCISRDYGFEYKNLNDFAVTVEAECWRSVKGQTETSKGEQPKPYITNTHTFILKAGEKYVWNAINRSHGDCDACAPNGYYYTIFKAYKNE